MISISRFKRSFPLCVPHTMKIWKRVVERMLRRETIRSRNTSDSCLEKEQINEIMALFKGKSNIRKIYSADTRQIHRCANESGNHFSPDRNITNYNRSTSRFLNPYLFTIVMMS